MGELVAYSRRRPGSCHEAEDLVQETMPRAWKARGGAGGRGGADPLPQGARLSFRAPGRFRTPETTRAVFRP
ncbi:sigma factor [Streptomyces sp. NPDC048282]|uniref:sigma factor n=1 Tax=Streptomyces sp. NPDC048282 TaxID=3365528 RepID=UPI00371D7193